MKKLNNYKTLLLPLLIVTIIFGTIYATTQQQLRMSGNDPQVQLAHDLAPQVTGDKLPKAADTGNVDIGTSLAPFVVVYNKAGEPVAGSGYLHGQLPQIPKGVLTASQNRSDNRVTWQPESGVRIASITVASTDHYVVVGRSLKEVENRSQSIFKIVIFGWLLTSAITVIYKRQNTGRKK